ncbi:MAG: DUF6279 family lipoprotein [Gammaproteobacteria bacterium]
MLLAAILLLSGCSSLQFAYNRLDWLISYQLGHFVNWTDSQEELLSQILEQQLHWHRSSQLPVYASWLQNLRTSLNTDTRLTVQDLDSYEADLRTMYSQLVHQLSPAAARLLSTLNTAQIEQLMTALEQRNREYYEERVAISVRAQRAYRVEQMLKQIERWLGEVTPHQRQRVQSWAAALELSSAETLAFREHWQKALRALLQQRQEADFQHRLRDLALDPESWQTAALRLKRQHNLQSFKQLLHDIYSQINSGQQQYLDNRLQTLSGDFIELAAQ